MRSQLDMIQGFDVDLSSLELRMIETMAVVLFLFLLRWLLLRLVHGRTADARSRYQWRKGSTYALFVIGLFAIGRVWFVGFTSITTFLGIAAAGLVIALKEPLLNMTGWLYLIWARPFVIGDRIQIGTHIGDVIDERVFEFTLLEVGNWIEGDQSTGRVIHVPNARVFQEPVANYTRGFPYLWDELQINITFESNWKAARALVMDALRSAGRVLDADTEARVLAESGHHLIFYSTLAPTVYTRVGERGIVLTARYVTEVRARRGTAQGVWEAVLEAFAGRDDIDFAYPTQRFFDRATEARTLDGADGADGTGGAGGAGNPGNPGV
ncbi:MAG TPA: mechanosensitive ion channel domain-containing protein [Longimicrobiales bacterium]|nr:mechanosensitive ion channel domain-containing protein [Longimicrobiales bacterium]